MSKFSCFLKSGTTRCAHCLIILVVFKSYTWASTISILMVSLVSSSCILVSLHWPSASRTRTISVALGFICFCQTAGGGSCSQRNTRLRESAFVLNTQRERERKDSVLKEALIGIRCNKTPHFYWNPEAPLWYQYHRTE